MFLQPLEIKSAGELNRELGKMVFRVETDRLQGSEPRVEALLAYVVSNHIEAFVPNLFRRSLHLGIYFFGHQPSGQAIFVVNRISFSA